MGSWPPVLTHAVHQHQLVLLLYNRNACNLCHGALAGSLGYRCEACNFDVHCTCLPSSPGGGTLTRGLPPHHAHPPPRAPRPSTPLNAGGAVGGTHHHHYYGGAKPSTNPAPSRWAWALPRLSLSLSEQFSHQPGAHAPVNHAPAPPPNHAYDMKHDKDNGPPRSYGHLQQQTNQPGDYGESYGHLQQQNDQTTNNQGGDYGHPNSEISFPTTNQIGDDSGGWDFWGVDGDDDDDALGDMDV